MSVRRCPCVGTITLVVVVLLAVVGLAAPVRVSAAPGPSDPVVGHGVRARLQQGDAVQVVAMLRRGPASADRAAERVRARSEQEAALSGLPSSVREVRRFSTIPAIVLRLEDVAALDALERRPNVVRVDLDEGGGTGALASAVPKINADDLHAQGIVGTGTTVAILDTGSDLDHPDLAGAVVHQACFGNGFGVVPSFCPNGTARQVGAGAAEDDAGHGTHVTGIVTSDGVVSAPGVAPGASIVGVKVTDSCTFSGCFYAFSEIAAALDYLFDHPELGVDVVNMSLATNDMFGGDCDGSASYLAAGAVAVDNLVASGVTLAAAAGNASSTTQMAAPACLRNVISVGATTNTDTVASFSNTSSTTDVLAPGSGIVSDAIGGGLTPSSGTSMASSVVAGCVALLRQAVPTVAPAAVANALRATGVPVARAGASFPRIDCAAAAAGVGFAPGVPTSFAPLSPSRIWDTRAGPGPTGRLGAGGTRDVTVTGIGGVPSSGVTAVVLNVTAVGPSAGTYVTAWPTGQPMPNASNLNIPPGDTRPNLVVVKVGSFGRVSFYNFAGTVDLIADVAGWYGATGGQEYTALTPARVWDTRAGPGPQGRLGAAGTRDVPITGLGGVPGTGVTAVVLNVTATGPSAGTFVTAWPTGEPMPNASNLNVPAGDTRPNVVVVRVGSGGRVSFYNFAGGVDLIADVAGYFSTAGSTFVSVSPARVWDTRAGPGPTGRMGAAGTREVRVTGLGGVPATGVTAVVLNVTATGPSAGTFVTAWPSGEERPVASNLNVPAGDTRPNLVIVKVGTGGRVSFYNFAGSTDLVADVAGWYGPVT